MGEDDEWPGIRTQILDSETFFFATPTWLGRPSSIAQRVLERMDAVMAHPNSMTPKRSRRVKVTTAETSNEPPQPSLLEKKMNKAATGPGEAPYIKRAPPGHRSD